MQLTAVASPDCWYGKGMSLISGFVRSNYRVGRKSSLVPRRFLNLAQNCLTFRKHIVFRNTYTKRRPGLDPILFFSFLTTTLLFVAVPGPSVAFATAQAMRHGPQAAYIAVAGDALGTMIHITVAVAGLTALVALSELILPFLQIAGGAFILIIAWHSFTNIGKPMADAPKRSNRATFWTGFFACVTNPKAIVFFVALFPAFISADHSILLQGIVYGGVFIVLDGLSILAYALLTSAAVKRTTSRWMNANLLSGLGLFSVGIAMIVKGCRAVPSN